MLISSHIGRYIINDFFPYSTVEQRCLTILHMIQLYIFNG